MATTVYEWDTINLVDGTIIEISPLKIKYLREFMDIFEFVKLSQDDDEAMRWMAECARVAMKQFYPQIKTIDDLETSLSMTELTTTVTSKREQDYDQKKFLAAIQGVNLDEENDDSTGNEWEEMKARVFSGGASSDPNDILSLQGANAAKAGFGLGNGLGYEKWD